VVGGGRLVAGCWQLLAAGGGARVAVDNPNYNSNKGCSIVKSGSEIVRP
jgi:hypothetical protein